MMILFPKKKGIKIATYLIIEEILANQDKAYIMGMIDFALRFGAITHNEKAALIQYLEER